MWIFSEASPLRKKRKPGWQKNRKRTPINCLSISDSWQSRKRKATPDKVTVRLHPNEMAELIGDATAVGMSMPAFLIATWKLSKIRPAHEMPRYEKKQ